MKQGRIAFIACALAACTLTTAATLARDAQAAPRKSSPGPAAAGSSARGSGTRQFSGWVTAFDAGSLTVEKRGKQPRTMVFAKDTDTETNGDVQKEVRVTVYYHDEDGHPTAQRVVVKPGSARGATKPVAHGAGSRSARHTGS